MAHKVSREALEKLQSNPSHIRNISIIAHVDHGKTTLSDCLISSNGIISQKLAGQVRYMDSTEEEQARGITMKSSAIALLHADDAARELKAESAPGRKTNYLINLIDSPGHVDFSVDVSAAARLADGALVVVDAVEGVCIQTHAVLRVAWAEGVKPVLVINKIDRLIVELQLSPMEAYAHLLRIIEQANVIMSELYTADLMASATQAADVRAHTAASASAAGLTSPTSSEVELALPDAGVDGAASDAAHKAYTFDAWGVDIDEAEEAKIFFDPTRGNVIFASAIDGWACSVDDFAALHCAKLEVDRALLRRGLWGDFYYKAKTKRIVTGAAAAAANKGKPLAVSLMLERLWAVYDAALLNPDEARVNKIVGVLNLQVAPRDLNSKDAKTKLQAVMRAWLPLHAAVLGMVVRRLPSPREAQAKRVDKLWKQVALPFHPQLSTQTSSSDGAPAAPAETALPALSATMSLQDRLARVRQCIATCNPSREAECVVYISKMFAVPRASLPASISMSAEMQATPDTAYWGMEPGTIGSPPGSRLNLAPVSSESKRAAARKRRDQTAGETAASEEAETDTTGAAGMELGSESDAETLIAFARVFSGVLEPTGRVFVLGPKYDPLAPAAADSLNISQVDSPMELYLMMGRDLSPLGVASAGSIIGIGGLSAHIMKTATLCSTPACLSLAPMTFQTTPLVKVAVEPVDPRDLPALERGLALLNQADPCVEITMTDRGEMQLSALGELHLDRCVKDLHTRFARVPLKVSPPILSFMETIVSRTTAPTAPTSPLATSPTVPTSGVALLQGSSSVFATTPDSVVTLRMSAAPLPPAVAPLMQSQPGVFRRIAQRAATLSALSAEARRAEDSLLDEEAQQVLRTLQESIMSAGSSWASDAAVLWTCGPKSLGPNLLFCRAPAVRLGQVDVPVKEYAPLVNIWEMLPGAVRTEPAAHAAALGPTLLSLCSAAAQGFQLCTSAGPLCAEPMWGVAFFIDEIIVRETGAESEDAAASALPTRLAVNAGQVIAVARDGFRLAFEAASPRLVEAMYRCELACSGGRGGGASGEQLGKLYAVLNRRRGRVLAEDMWEGTQTFVITALLPVVESFGFADDLRTMTSGAATSPQLLFSHWEVLEQDPFFVPTTEEEKEEYGDVVHEGQIKNLAKRYMDAVRERKGLPVDRKIVVHAEKQRNMSRKK